MMITSIADPKRRRRSRATANLSADMALIRWKSEGIHVSPQLVLAAFQYLSTCELCVSLKLSYRHKNPILIHYFSLTAVEHFNDQRISKTILQRLLNQNLFFQIKVKNRDKGDPANVIYERVSIPLKFPRLWPVPNVARYYENFRASLQTILCSYLKAVFRLKWAEKT